MLLGWAEEARVLRWLGLGQATTICDLGSGPGYVAASLLHDFPSVQVTGLDRDGELLRFARAAMPSRARFIQGDANALPFASSTFDFVMARHLYQHLDDAAAVTREALRVLKPGGTLAVIDVDAALWGLTTPALPDLEPVAGGGPRAGGRLVGRQLYRLLRDAGFEQVHLDAFVYHSDELGMEAFLPHVDPARFEPLLRAGTITRDSLDRFSSAHEALIRDDDAFVLLAGLIASGTRPAGG